MPSVLSSRSSAESESPLSEPDVADAADASDDELDEDFAFDPDSVFTDVASKLSISYRSYSMNSTRATTFIDGSQQRSSAPIPKPG